MRTLLTTLVALALASPATATPPPIAVLGAAPQLLNPSPAAPLTRQLPAAVARCWAPPPDALQGFHFHEQTGRLFHVTPKQLEFGTVPAGDCTVAVETSIGAPARSSFVTVPSVSSDGRTVAVGLAGGEVLIWRDGAVTVWAPGVWSARRTTVSSDGLYVFTTGEMGTARLDVAVAETDAVPAVHFEPIDAFAAAPDGFVAASSDRASKLIAWDLVTLRPRFVRPGLHAVGFTDGGRWLVTRDRDRRVVVVDALDGAAVVDLDPCADHGGSAMHVSVAARAPTLWSVCDGGAGPQVHRFDLDRSSRPAATLTHQLASGGWGLSALSVSPDGEHVALSEGGSHRLLVLDGETLAVTDIWRFGKRGVPTVKAWLAEGFVGQPAFGYAGVLAVLGADAPRSAWPATGAYISSAAVLPDGRLLTGDENGVVAVRSADGRKQLRTWPAHEGSVRGLAPTYDGRQLVSAGSDAVRIWPI